MQLWCFLPCVRAAVLLAAMACVQGPACAQDRAESKGRDGPLELPDAIAGILHYTRWPAPTDPLRLCVNERDADAALIVRRFEAGYRDLPRVLPLLKRISIELANEPLDCHAVFFGRMPGKEAQAVLLRLGRHPVLTIGRDEDFCSYSGLFCLSAMPGGGLHIGVNLDSIARNGLRVNPMLLKLTTREPRSRP